MNENKQYHLYTEDEKLKIINDHEKNHLSIRACAKKYDIAKSSLVMWLRAYRSDGIGGLKCKIGKYKGPNKGRPKGSTKPKSTIEELERENLKLKIEIERLKKGYYVKGVGQRKEYISINNRSSKSLEN